jgi:NAD(P)H dehydrogenase (quinone)
MNGVKLFVTGSTGQLGRRVIEILVEKNVRVRGGTRHQSKLSSPGPSGVEIVIADFDRPQTLERAFVGIDRLLLISTPSYSNRFQQHKNAIDAAVKAGVKHIVYTSFVTAPLKTFRSPHWQVHNQTEDYIADSGASFTILRNNLYYEVLPLMTIGIGAGTWKHAFSEPGRPGQGGIAFVAREDCASAAASALSSNSAKNALWTITGPAVLTADEIAAHVSIARGTLHTAETVTAEELRKELQMAFAGSATLREHIDELITFHTQAAASFMSAVTPDVMRLTGQPPMAIEDWIRANKDAFA